jgi:hypothetical protein
MKWLWYEQDKLCPHCRYLCLGKSVYCIPPDEFYASSRPEGPQESTHQVKFRKKPVVEAMQFDGSDLSGYAIREWHTRASIRRRTQ